MSEGTDKAYLVPMPEQLESSSWSSNFKNGRKGMVVIVERNNAQNESD